MHAGATVDARLFLAGDDRTEDLASVSGVVVRTIAGESALSGIPASSSVLAWAVVRAIVQILIAEHSTPAFVAIAIVGFVAGAVVASGVTFALGAKRSLPPFAAFALVGHGAIPVFFGATSLANSNIAVFASPPLVADFFAFFTAREVAVTVIAGLTPVHALGTEVIMLTDESVAVLERLHAQSVGVIRPRLADRQGARAHHPFEQLILASLRWIFMPGLENESEIARPSEGDIKHEGFLMLRNLEAVSSHDFGRQFPECAVVVVVDRLLVVFETNAEEGFARLRTRSRSVEDGASAALAVRVNSRVVDERFELKLEDPSGGDLRNDRQKRKDQVDGDENGSLVCRRHF